MAGAKESTTCDQNRVVSKESVVFPGIGFINIDGFFMKGVRTVGHHGLK